MSLKLSGLVSGMDTDSMVKELMKAQNLKKTKIENKITTSEWKQDKWKTLNSKIYSFYTGALTKLKLQGNYSTKTAASSDESIATVTANGSAAEGTQTLSVQKLASAQFVTGSQLASTVTSDTKLVDLGMTAGPSNIISIKTGTTTKDFEIKADSTVGDLVTALKSAGLNANYDTVQKRFFISAKDSGNANAFEITTAGSVDMTKLGLDTITKTVNGDSVTINGGSNVKIVQPSDSKVTYNGVAITGTTNTIAVNGLTINIKKVSGDNGTPNDASDDPVINLNIKNDTQAVYNMVKDFVKTYNDLLSEMNTNYGADSSKGYEPLTDEQKSSMTDDQITKWESKIKDSLLRRDDNLSSLINTMRTTMSGSISVNGKSYALSSFGISSVNYTEEGKLHIKGDADDTLTAGSNNDLMTALQNDPDTVKTVLTGLAGKLYDSLNKDMTSTTLRSSLTIYNDKELTQTITNYKKDLSTLEDKLSDMETRYYKQFSKMESAMSEMNSKSSSLSSLLGKG
jgi:Flagellar capping protein